MKKTLRARLVREREMDLKKQYTNFPSRCRESGELVCRYYTAYTEEFPQAKSKNSARGRKK